MVSTKVFIPSSSRKNRVFDIINIMGCKEQKGDVGIEVEVEGNKFPKTGGGHDTGHFIPSVWGYHHDGSLRGLDNAEYVLKKPIQFGQVPEAVNSLWQMFDEFGSKLDDSNRTSVHIHLNVQSWHLNRLCSFMALYFSVEELLTAWCGDHRVGNLFCLRAKDAPAIISRIKKFIKTDGTGGLTDGLHYSAMNAQAIQKFGSVEIRTLRGVTDPQIIIKWVEILRRIYDLSAEYPDPRSVCAGFSGSGPLEYLQTVLGEHTNTIKEGIGYDTQQIMESLYEGIRMAQDLTYCRDWDDFQAMVIRPDPFGRATKKVAKKIADNSWLMDIENGSITPTTTISAPYVTGSHPMLVSLAHPSPPIPASAYYNQYANLDALNSDINVEEWDEMDLE